MSKKDKQEIKDTIIDLVFFILIVEFCFLIVFGG